MKRSVSWDEGSNGNTGKVYVMKYSVLFVLTLTRWLTTPLAAQNVDTLRVGAPELVGAKLPLGTDSNIIL